MNLEDHQIHFNNALKKWNDRDLRGALIECENALGLNSEFPKAIRLKAWIHYRLTQLNEAKAAYIKLIRLKKAELTDFYDMGKIENILGEHEQAILYLEYCMSINSPAVEDLYAPFDAWIFAKSSYYLANSLYNLEEHQKASQVCQDWINYWDISEATYTEFNAEFLRLSACIYDELGDRQIAFKTISKALELNSKCSKIYYDSGVIKRGCGDIRGALIDFKKSFELEPSFMSAVHNIGSIYLELGEVTLACEYWKKGSKLGNVNSKTQLEKHCSSQKDLNTKKKD